MKILISIFDFKQYVCPTFNTNAMSNLYQIRILIRKLCYITFSDKIFFFVCVYFGLDLFLMKDQFRKKWLPEKKDSGDGPTVWLPSIDEQKQKEKINQKGNNIGGRERESSIVGVSCSRDDVTQSGTRLYAIQLSSLYHLMAGISIRRFRLTTQVP